MTRIKLSDHFNYKKLFRFVLPSVIMMVFTSIYGIVDGFFVSRFVGETQFAALNLIFPFIMILGIKTLLLGDNALSSEINNSYRTNGISHLFSISGMHISLITSIIYFYLNRVTHNKILKHLIIDMFLILYLLLV